MSDKVKITKRAVDALKATDTRYVAWDTDLPGFGCASARRAERPMC